ncbi:hypothetical protein AB0F42_26485 [Streptomyces buecherae]
MTLSGISTTSDRRTPYREMPWTPQEIWAICPQYLKPPARWPLWRGRGR